MIRVCFLEDHRIFYFDLLEEQCVFHIIAIKCIKDDIEEPSTLVMVIVISQFCYNMSKRTKIFDTIQGFSLIYANRLT
jgi:hypothetical protein